MRRVRYNAAITLDGFIASPDGSTPWIVDDTTIDFDALYAEFDVFLMGRKTYEAMVRHGNPLAGREKESVVVVSTTMQTGDYPGITVISGGVVGWVRKMRDARGRDIWVMGGGQLVGELMREGLVDSIEAAVMPVVIGRGVPMISGLSEEEVYKLELQGVSQLESGILMTRYKVLPRDE